MTLNLNFDEDQHLYYTDAGVIVPSVTQVLEDVGIVDKQWFNDQAKIRGTYIHKATELHDKKTLVEKSLDPILVPYFEAYKKFLHDTGFVPELIEHMVYCVRYGYAGTLDRSGIWPGVGRVFLDIKSGYAPDWAALQLAAYVMSEPFDYDMIFTLQLKDNGTYAIHEHRHNGNNFTQFLYALKTYQYKHKEIEYYEKEN